MKDEARTTSIPLLRANNIGDRLSFDDVYYVPDRFVSDKQLLQDGDIVIAMSSGSKSIVGKAAIAISVPRSSFGAFCGVVRPTQLVDGRYFGYYFQTKSYRQAISGASKSTGINNLKAEHVLNRPLPLPPRDEQACIASKIDELFSSIDEGERALERLRRLVERYRQSVLKAAVTGELTREWRKQRADEFESGEALLTRILEARREVWAKSELNKMTAKGVRPSSEDWKKRYKQAVSPNSNELPQLPEGWTWASLPQLGEFGRGKSKYRPRNSPTLYGGKYPFIQTGIVRSSKGNISSFTSTYNDVGLAQSKLWPKGTICITIAANIAESGILGMDACFPDSIVGLVPMTPVVTEYIELFFANRAGFFE